jgi:bifunctional UDP-N-acetylglucosamine pyrophosphorylase/glucosamine-1-phosphate N-acetyltransferase
MKTTAVILAAGQGRRMLSNKPKVLHRLMGKPMLQYSLDIIREITNDKPVIVIGHGAQAVEESMSDQARFVVQEPLLGTGHALLQAETLLSGKTDRILVITADMPLLRSETLQRLIGASQKNSTPVTMLTVEDKNPRGFGRVVRDEQKDIVAIVEEAQATAQQLKITEINPSVYCFRDEWIWSALRRIPLSKKGEFYLTDVIEIAIKDGFAIQALPVEDVSETVGINTRVHLAEAVAILRDRINHELMISGVTIIDPTSTYIEDSVTIMKDTIIWPNTYLEGKTIIGENCQLGPNTIVRDARIGNNCRILASVVDRAILDDRVDIGPYANLRKGAHLCEGVHMGNFGEIKNSTLGPGTKMGHFSYIGDATIGSHVNIGAGTITCNYDGEKKNVTEIGEGVFIGSDTMLVAPVKLGEGSHTGAGAVVTKDVPPYSLAVGVPARVIRKLEKRD